MKCPSCYLGKTTTISPFRRKYWYVICGNAEVSWQCSRI